MSELVTICVFIFVYTLIFILTYTLCFVGYCSAYLLPVYLKKLKERERRRVNYLTSGIIDMTVAIACAT